MKNKKWILLILFGILLITVTDSLRATNYFYIQNNFYDTSNSQILSYYPNPLPEVDKIGYQKIHATVDGNITNICAYLKYVTSNVYAKACLYSSSKTYIKESSPVFINTNYFSLYTFTINYKVTENTDYYISVFPDADTHGGGTYICISYINTTGLNCYSDDNERYPNFPTNLGTDTTYTNKQFSLFANLTALPQPFVYNNTKNTSGKYEVAYNNTNDLNMWLNFTGITTPISLFERLFNVTGTHTYTLNSSGYNVTANYTANCSGNGSFDPNASGDWLYLGATLDLDESQFFLVFLTALWTFFIYMLNDTRRMLYGYAMIMVGIPLTLIISGISYFRSYPFGYLIAICFLLITLLIPLVSFWDDRRK